MNGKLPNTHRVPGIQYKKTVQLFGTFAKNDCKNVTFNLPNASVCMCVWLKNCSHYFHITLQWVILLKQTLDITTFLHYRTHIQCTSLNIHQSKTCCEHNVYRNKKHIFCVQHSLSVNMTGLLITKNECRQMCQNCQAPCTFPDFLYESKFFQTKHLHSYFPTCFKEKWNLSLSWQWLLKLFSYDMMPYRLVDG
jgi:hypothetical protein